MNTDRTHATLQRIATILDVPASAFHQRHTSVPGDLTSTTLRETAELLDAFAEITDPTIRRDCIAFIRARSSTAKI